MKTRYHNLFSEIKKRKPKTIMEIGTWNGNHARLMWKTAKKYQKDVIYYGFDLFEIRNKNINKKEHNVKKICSKKSVEKALSKHGVKYVLFQGFSRDTVVAFNPEEPIDFLYIDGGHSVQTIFDDWNNCQKLIGPETIVIFDDYYLHRKDTGCNQVIDSINREEYNIEFLKPIDKIGTQRIQFVKVSRRVQHGT